MVFKQLWQNFHFPHFPSRKPIRLLSCFKLGLSINCSHRRALEQIVYLSWNFWCRIESLNFHQFRFIYILCSFAASFLSWPQVNLFSELLSYQVASPSLWLKIRIFSWNILEVIIFGKKLPVRCFGSIFSSKNRSKMHKNWTVS